MKTVLLIVWWLLAFAASARHEFAAEGVNGNTLFGDLDGNGANEQTQADLDDLEDRLTQTVRGGTTITLTYDGDGQRVKKTAGATTTWYLVDDRNPTGYAQVLEERTTANGSPTVLCIRGTGYLLADSD